MNTEHEKIAEKCAAYLLEDLDKRQGTRLAIVHEEDSHIKNSGWGKGALRRVILDAIREATTPQWDEAKAIGWPTEPGLWLACNGERMVLVFVCRSYGGIYVAAACREHLELLSPGWRFCGPLTIPLPAIPAPPAPWDYEPQEGDYVWLSRNGKICGCFKIRRDGGWLRVDGFARGNLDNPAWEELARCHYRFAKAEVSPPPEIGGVK